MSMKLQCCDVFVISSRNALPRVTRTFFKLKVIFPNFLTFASIILHCCLNVIYNYSSWNSHSIQNKTQTLELNYITL